MNLTNLVKVKSSRRHSQNPTTMIFVEIFVYLKFPCHINMHLSSGIFLKLSSNAILHNLQQVKKDQQGSRLVAGKLHNALLM